jgi:hypothetical protein
MVTVNGRTLNGSEVALLVNALTEKAAADSFAAALLRTVALPPEGRTVAALTAQAQLARTLIELMEGAA